MNKVSEADRQLRSRSPSKGDANASGHGHCYTQVEKLDRAIVAITRDLAMAHKSYDCLVQGRDFDAIDAAANRCSRLELLLSDQLLRRAIQFDKTQRMAEPTERKPSGAAFMGARRVVDTKRAQRWSQK